MRVYAILTHSFFHVVPQFSLNEVFTVWRQSKSQAAEKTISHTDDGIQWLEVI